MQSTLKRLETQFEGPLLPLEVVRANFFPHLGDDQFRRRARANDLGFPVIRADQSQKSAMFVHVEDLAHYLDLRATIARHEHAALRSATKTLPDRAEPLPARL